MVSAGPAESKRFPGVASIRPAVLGPDPRLPIKAALPGPTEARKRRMFSAHTAAPIRDDHGQAGKNDSQPSGVCSGGSGSKPHAG